MKVKSSPTRRIIISALVLVISGQACTLSLFDTSTVPGASTVTPGPVLPTNTPHPVAQTTFITTIPEPLQPGETLTIAVVDEVTGLPINPTTYPMTARDPLTFSAVLPLPFQTVVKYRYIKRSNQQVVEDTTKGTAIRYRLYYVAGPAEVSDIVAD